MAAPCIEELISNINSCFSGTTVKLLISSSIFNPVSIQTEDSALPAYGQRELQTLVEFYGKEATVEFGGTTYTSAPLIDGEEIIAEWRGVQEGPG